MKMEKNREERERTRRIRVTNSCSSSSNEHVDICNTVSSVFSISLSPTANFPIHALDLFFFFLFCKCGYLFVARNRLPNKMILVREEIFIHFIYLFLTFQIYSALIFIDDNGQRADKYGVNPKISKQMSRSSCDPKNKNGYLFPLSSLCKERKRGETKKKKFIHLF